VHVGIVRPKGHQASRLDQLPVGVDGGETLACGKVHDATPVVEEDAIGEHDESARPLSDDRVEGRIELVRGTHADRVHLHVQHLGRGTRLSLRGHVERIGGIPEDGHS
jgi:hypothetical protein